MDSETTCQLVFKDSEVETCTHYLNWVARYSLIFVLIYVFIGVMSLQSTKLA